MCQKYMWKIKKNENLHLHFLGLDYIENIEVVVNFDVIVDADFNDDSEKSIT